MDHEGLAVAGQLADDIIARYKLLGLYEAREDGRQVILRDLPVLEVDDLVTSIDEEDTQARADLLALARAAGTPEDELEEGWEERVITLTASDESTDRYGDRILVDGTLDVDGEARKFGKGWNTKEYETNPVLMPWHSYREIPLGRALKTWTDAVRGRKRLRQIVLFDNGTANAAAPVVNAAYRKRLMRTFSVGFWPEVAYRPVDDDERKKLKLGPYGYLFGQQVLWENSAVSIPANPNAMSDKDVLDLTDEDLEGQLGLADELKDLMPEYSYRIRATVEPLVVRRRSIVSAVAPPQPAPVPAAVPDPEHAPAERLAVPAPAQLPDNEAVAPIADLMRSFGEQLRATMGVPPAPIRIQLDNPPENSRVVPAMQQSTEAGAIERLTALADRFEAVVARAEEAVDRIAKAGTPGRSAPEGDSPESRYDEVLDVFEDTVRALVATGNEE